MLILTIDPSLTKQHVRNVVFRSYILYVKSKYPDIDLDIVCQEIGLTKEYLLNENNWVSVEVDYLFVEKLKLLTRDPELSEKAGAFGVQPHVSGNLLNYLFNSIVNINLVYQNFPLLINMFNKFIKLKIVNKEGNELTYVLERNYQILDSYEKEIADKLIKEIAKNISGYFSSYPKQRGLPTALVKITELNEFIEMKVLLPAQGKILSFDYKINFFSAVLLFAISLGLKVIYPSSFKILLFVDVLMYVAIFSVFREVKRLRLVSREAKENLSTMDSQYKSLEETKIALQAKLRDTDAIRTLVDNLLAANSEDEILSKATKTLNQVLKFDRIVILMANESKTFLQYRNSLGVSTLPTEQLINFKLKIDIDSSDSTKLSNVYRMNWPILIADVKAHVQNLEDPESKFYLEKSGSKSFIAVPLSSGSDRFGVLIVDNFSPSKTLNAGDKELLTLAGQQIGIAIEKERAKSNLITSLNYQVDLSQAYAKFVSLESMKFLGYKDIFDVKIGDGAEKTLSILFSDIRDFSSLCETMSPTDVLKFLNSFFGRIGPIVKANNGIVDKFIGDCLMAVFKSPTDALRAGIEIQRDLVKYNLERRIGGRKLIEVGIGICTGPVILGTLGSYEKIEITVLSDTVNIASRLDGMCKDLKARILISGQSMDFTLAREGCFEIDHGMLPVKGKHKNVKIIEIVDPKLSEVFLNENLNLNGTEAGEYFEKIKKEVNDKKNRVNQRKVA